MIISVARCIFCHCTANSSLLQIRANGYLRCSSRISRHLRSLCTSLAICQKDDVFRRGENVKRDLKTYVEARKVQLKHVEARFKQRGRIVFSDIKETKQKVKNKMGEIIERENIYTIPNLLCLSRILLSPYLGFLIVEANFDYALGVLFIAAITDMLDGWIARTWANQSSKIGSFLDPMADKVLIATLFLTLTYANLIPVLLTAIIIVKDVLLVVASFIIRYKSLPPPRTLSRFFDVTHATVQLAPTLISKVNTAVQLLFVGSTLAAPVFHYVGHPVLESLCYFTGATTIAAGISYALSKDSYKYLKQAKVKRT